MSRKSTLRDVQKAQTRQRLLEAACHIFNRKGIEAATISDIVARAGASRPTFYLHFQDKREVLHELMSQYFTHAIPLLERFPGPQPTVAELKGWLCDSGSFLEKERELFDLLMQVIGSREPGQPTYGLEAMTIWIQKLGEKAPAFAAAVSKQNPQATARAELLILQIAWATIKMLRDRSDEVTEATLEVVAVALHEFLSDASLGAGKPSAPAGVGVAAT
ncbi:MAG TPA: TetR/AcrR family transcriptional regulator [Pseudomonadaceae bacterium]|nr:TetR/AcrR family transcriptional regulator [Pseudomonadaceae bacterium]